MSRHHLFPKTPTKRTIHLCPERIPVFLNQSLADRALAHSMADLNNRLKDGDTKVCESAEDALARVGFIRR